MNKKESKKYEKLLVNDLERLSNGIRKIEESALHESVRETTGDLYSYAETGTDNFERETALNIATNESERLRDGVWPCMWSSSASSHSGWDVLSIRIYTGESHSALSCFSSCSLGSTGLCATRSAAHALSRTRSG